MYTAPQKKIISRFFAGAISLRDIGKSGDVATTRAMMNGVQHNQQYIDVADEMAATFTNEQVKHQLQIFDELIAYKKKEKSFESLWIFPTPPWP